MPPPRRQLLRSCSFALGVGVAGCLSTGRSDESFRTPTDCPDDSQVPEPEPHPDGEALPPVPEPPESLADVDAVAEYVEAYELAYRSRTVTTKFDSPIVSVNLDAVASTRGAHAGGVLVDVEGLVHGRVDYEHVDSDSPGHFDGAHYPASYLVTDAAVWRVRGGRDADTSELQPHEDGELLECY